MILLQTPSSLILIYLLNGALAVALCYCILAHFK